MIAKSTLIVVKEEKYPAEIVKLAKELATKKVCYVTLNKTYDSLLELFKKHKINTNNIKFIDGITRSIRDVENTEDCTYISSPEAITELAIVIDTHLEYPFDYIIFDSMHNLPTYTSEEIIKKFIKSLVVKLNGKKTKLAIITLDVPEQQGLIRAVGAFVEKTAYKR